MKGNKTFVLPLLMYGGIGDYLLCTPMIRALKNKYPNSKLIAVFRKNTPMKNSILYNNPYIDDYVFVGGRFSMFIADIVFRLRRVIFLNHNYGELFPTKTYPDTHVTELIGEMTGLKLTDTKLDIFTSEKETRFAQEQLKECKNPIIVNITSMCGEKQMWPKENWNELIRIMPEYTFIQVGLEDEEPLDNCVNFLGKTTVREVAALVKHAGLFVGVESFVAHTTNAFDVPGVVLFGDSSPSIWGHKNNINLYKNLDCGPCVDATRVCPYNIDCMTTITVDEVRDAILKQKETLQNHSNVLNGVISC